MFLSVGWQLPCFQSVCMWWNGGILDESDRFCRTEMSKRSALMLIHHSIQRYRNFNIIFIESTGSYQRVTCTCHQVKCLTFCSVG